MQNSKILPKLLCEWGSWSLYRTEQKFDMISSHGSLIIRDFCVLYETIDSSIQTLKQLGQSRYSSEMKDNLLFWCDVVEKATRYVNF